MKTQKPNKKVVFRNIPSQQYLVKDGFFVKPIKEDYRVKIHFDKLVWVEAISNYTHFHLNDGKEPVSVAISMKQVEELLPPDRFVRINRSAIVNSYFVEKYCGNSLDVAHAHCNFVVTAAYHDDVFSRFIELRRDD